MLPKTSLSAFRPFRTPLAAACLLLAALVPAAGQPAADPGGADDRGARAVLLEKRPNTLSLRGRGLGEEPSLYLVLSSRPLSGAERSVLDNLSAAAVADLAAGGQAPRALAIRLHGKKAGRGGTFEYHFGAGQDAARPWNAGPEFTISSWTSYEDAVWSHAALVLDPQAARGGEPVVVESVRLVRSGVLLFDSTLRESHPHGNPVGPFLRERDLRPAGAFLPVLDLGPAMTAFRSAYYECGGVPVLEAAYGELGRTDAKGYTLRGTAWCSEFASWACRRAGYPTPDPDRTDANWRSMRDYFDLEGTVYSVAEVLSWTEETRRARVPPGSFVSLVLSPDGSTHSFLLGRWIDGDPAASFTAVSGNNLGTVWAHAAVSLRDRVPPREFTERAYVAVPPGPGSPVRSAPARPPLPRFEWTDRLAADAQAAAWRALGMSPAAEASLDGLSLDAVGPALARGSGSPMETAKRIHDWITRHVAYDSNLLLRMKELSDPQGGTDAESAFAYRRSNCAGLARLYERLARSAGLDARTVLGFIKSGETSRGDLASHAWNVVRIGGDQYIVDCSADSRVFWKNGKLSETAAYEERSDHLFLAPEAKALAYLAAKPEDQLLAQPRTVEAFRSRPRFTIAYATYGLEFLGVSGGSLREARDKPGEGASALHDEIVSPAGSVELRFRIPPDAFLDAYLSDASGKALSDRVRVGYEPGLASLSFCAPAAGSFRCSVNARSLARPDRVNLAWSFLLAADAAGTSLSGVSTTFQAPLLGVSLRDRRFDAVAGEWILDLDGPEGMTLVGTLRDAGGRAVSGACRALETRTGWRLFFGLPDGGKYGLAVSGRPDTDPSGRGNQRLFTVTE